MLVSMTVTPVLCYYLLPKMKRLDHGDSPLVAWLKRRDAQLLAWSFRACQGADRRAPRWRWPRRRRRVPFFPRAFLPRLQRRLAGAVADAQPRHLAGRGQPHRRGRRGPDRRSARSHAGRPAHRPRRTRRTCRRRALGRDRRRPEAHRSAIASRSWPTSATSSSVLPAQVAIGQPIAHRLDHLLSGVRAQIALKIYGDDTDTLRGLAESLRAQLSQVPGLVDLTVEKQVLIPQITVRLDHRKAAQAGLSPGEAIRRAAGADRRRARCADRRRRAPLRAGAAPAGRPAQPAGPGAHADRHARPGACRCRASPRWKKPTARTRSAARTAAGASSSMPTPTAATWAASSPTSAASIAKARAADRQLRQPGRPVPGAGAGHAADRRPVAGVAGDDVPGAVLALPVGGAGRHHHGQHPAGADRQRGGDVDRRRAACRWRRWSASSRWPASPRATAS